MTITLNGQAHELSSPFSISELLETLGMAGKPVVVEHNQTALFPRQYDETVLSDGDQLEIISIAAGG